MPKSATSKKVIELSDDEVEEVEVEEVEVEESQSESDNEEADTDTEKKKIKKLNSEELFNDIVTRFTTLESSDNDFNEKEKAFEKEHKEYQSSRKKSMRELSTIIKRFEKIFKHDMSKKKPRKTEYAGKGGFNKQVEVPELLRTFIGIDKEELMSRPQVTKLLNQKFTELNLMKTKKDEESGKETKVIILDKATAKKLKRKDGDEIRNRDIQTFIAHFYKEGSEVLHV
jgi:hypothetical protein